MCIFSAFTQHVSNTNIVCWPLANQLHGYRIVYSNDVATEQRNIMVLPVNGRVQNLVLLPAEYETLASRMQSDFQQWKRIRFPNRSATVSRSLFKAADVLAPVISYGPYDVSIVSDLTTVDWMQFGGLRDARAFLALMHRRYPSFDFIVAKMAPNNVAEHKIPLCYDIEVFVDPKHPGFDSVMLPTFHIHDGQISDHADWSHLITAINANVSHPATGQPFVQLPADTYWLDRHETDKYFRDSLLTLDQTLPRLALLRHATIRSWRASDYPNIDTWLVYRSQSVRSGGRRKAPRLTVRKKHRVRGRFTPTVKSVRRRDDWLKRATTSPPDVVETFLHEGLCDIAGGESPQSSLYRNAVKLAKQRLKQLRPTLSTNTIDRWTDQKLCREWSKEQIVVSSVHTRQCTPDAKNGAFRAGTVQDGKRTCWKLDDLVKLANDPVNSLRFSPDSLNTIQRYRDAVTHPEQLPCYQRRDVPSACEALPGQCAYTHGESGWIRTLGVITRLMRQTGAPGDCVPTREYVEQLQQLCATESKKPRVWTHDDLVLLRLLVVDLLAQLGHRRLYLPMANDPRALPEETRAARDTLDAYNDQVRQCISSWSPANLCTLVTQLLPTAVLQSATRLPSLKERLAGLAAMVTALFSPQHLVRVSGISNKLAKTAQGFLYEISTEQTRLLLESVFPKAKLSDELVEIVAFGAWLATSWLFAAHPLVYRFLAIVWRAIGTLLVQLVGDERLPTNWDGAKRQRVTPSQLTTLFLQGVTAVLVTRASVETVDRLWQDVLPSLPAVDLKHVSSWVSTAGQRTVEWLKFAGLSNEAIAALPHVARGAVEPAKTFLSELAQVQASKQILVKALGLHFFKSVPANMNPPPPETAVAPPNKLDQAFAPMCRASLAFFS